MMDSYANRLMQSYETTLPLVGPLNASIPLTSRCNSHCLYCPPDRTRHVSEPSTAVLKDLFQQLHVLGVRQVSLTGGEPTLRRDLEKIVATAQESGLSATLLTNGTLLSRPRLTALVDAGLKGIVVSFDTLSPQKFRSIRGVPIKPVLNGIEVLTEARQDHLAIFTCVTSVITKHNFRDLPALATYLAQRGLHYQVQPVINHPELTLDPNDREAMAALKAAIQAVLDIYATRYTAAEKYYTAFIPAYIATGHLPARFRCLAMITLVHLDIELNVYPCWPLPVVGTVKTQSLKNLWNSDEMHSARMQLKENGCPSCWLLCDAKPSLQYQLEEVSHEN
jgi:MoaA/NifB/PqqE/SkfB family radical SAM enzyme